MIPLPNLGVEKREIARIDKELLKLQTLADPSQRGTSAGSVVRYALNRSGRKALQATKRRVPRGTAPATNRKRLRQTVRGKTELDRRTRRLWFRAGYRKDLAKRFQQVLAIEWGTRYIRRHRPLKRGLDDAIGVSGERFRRDFINEMRKRIAALASKANAAARLRR